MGLEGGWVRVYGGLLAWSPVFPLGTGKIPIPPPKPAPCPAGVAVSGWAAALAVPLLAVGLRRFGFGRSGRERVAETHAQALASAPGSGAPWSGSGQMDKGPGAPALGGRGPSVFGSSGTDLLASPQGGPSTTGWELVLRGVEIAEQRELLPAPPITRTLSWTGVAEEAADPSAGLPASLRSLVREHPEVLSYDAAARFLAGLDTEAKALAGMQAMVDWVGANGMQGIVARRQPTFAVIKSHYTHGLLGRARDGSVVELECLSQLPAAFPRMVAAGVSQEALLAHLMFTYEYVFKVLDPAPLPGGKTYKIVDLGDMHMGDLRSEGFRFISKAGAVLAVNFPQRLHRAFLINVPSWW